MGAFRLSLLLCLAFALLGATAAATERAQEPFFPRAGTLGIDVDHYGVSLHFDPRSGTIRANEAILMNSTRRLRRIGLDLKGLHVTSVEVNSQPARFSRGRERLWIRPRTAIVDGENFFVVIYYRGRPASITDADGTKEGWLRTDDGALALGEPQGAATWLPCSNVPADKATFDVHIDVPRPLVGVSNGVLTKVERIGKRRRFTWHGKKPMSTYLALIDIGRGQLVESEIAGHPSWTLVDPRLAERSRPVLAALPEIVRFESKLFGGYPFEAAGSVVDEAPEVGYALETQTRPFYPYAPDLTTVVHETAHQWFGDSVGLKRWPNIWLNEGFATWTEWYYSERHGGRSARAIFSRLHRVPASNTEFWNPPSGHPGSAKHLFGPSVYVRGAMALEALRLKIGTRAMLQLLRRWAITHRYGSADIAEFTALAEQVSGKNLDPLFQRWLYKRGKP